MHDLTVGLGDVILIDGIEVKVVDVQPDRVRLGITAPRHVPVHRKEVYLAIQRGRPRTRPTDSPGRSPQDKEPR
jgi:carbon storage regulator